jgi:hypothetical protein
MAKGAQRPETQTVPISGRPCPDRDQDGIVRFQIIEDRDPQSVGTWRSFELRSTVRLPEDDFTKLKAACSKPGSGKKPSDVIRDANTGKSAQFAALVAAVEPIILKMRQRVLGTGGVPNFMVTADYGSATPGYRCTIHTEIFLTSPTAQDIEELWQIIATGTPHDAATKLGKIGVVTDPEMLEALLGAALGP